MTSHKRLGALLLILVATAAFVVFAPPPAPGIDAIVEPEPNLAARKIREALVATEGPPSVKLLYPRDSIIHPDGSRTTGRSLFGQAPRRTRADAEPATAPSAPTGPPPIPFQYLGKALTRSGWEVYLAEGENVYIVREADSIDGSYLVEKIDPPEMTLTFKPLGAKETLSIE